MAPDLKELDALLSSRSELVRLQYPKHTYSTEENILGVSLVKWITEAGTMEELKNRVADLPFGTELRNHVTRILDSFSSDMFDHLVDIDPELVIKDGYGSWLQNSLDPGVRKQYAANYTQDADNIIAQINIDTSEIRDVIDPFSGSGRLLTAYLQSISPKQRKMLSAVHSNEIMPTAAILSYVRMKTLYPEVRIKVSSRDGFSLKGNYDLVIMNPPFTRSHNITSEIKESLGRLSQKYRDNYRQSGLHIWAIYLADTLLRSGGTILTVLPAAAIMSRYSQNLKDFLLSEYHNISLFTFQRSKAYSQGSSLKELFLQAVKGKTADSVNFTTLEQDLEDLRTTTIGIEQLKNTWNWTSLYSRPELVNMVKQLQSELQLTNADAIGIEIIRGIELYGPNFFFFPNKHWQLDYPAIYNEGKRLHFTQSQLHPVLRKPSIYKQQISPDINEYCLVVDGIDDNLEEYIKINQNEGKVAQRRFGETWIHHIRDQIRQKNPRGHLFVIDKMDLSHSSLLCHYTDRSYLCTKNFYVVKLPTKTAKLLAAWMNSSLFLALYLVYRREIGGTFGRMQIMDYYQQDLFLPSIEMLDTKEILQSFDNLRQKELDFLDRQIESETKRDLDEAIINATGLSIDLELLYAYITAEFEELKIRS